MLDFIKSLFARNTNEFSIINLHIIDDVEDKNDVVLNTRIFIPCIKCGKQKHVLIKCC